MNYQRILVIGGAGFIGSHLVRALRSRGHAVVVYDRATLDPADIRADIADVDTLRRACKGQHVVYHLAANSDARRGVTERMLDVRENAINTALVLDAVTDAKVQNFIFTSSAAVYGRSDNKGPRSLYGATKLACEAMISAYEECFGLRSAIYRPGNVVGPGMTHGCIRDFLYQLQGHPQHLAVLGNGWQRKPYVHVDYVVKRLIRPEPGVADLGPPDFTYVRTIATGCAIESALRNPGVQCEITYGEEHGGWPGDVDTVLMAPDQKLSSNGAADLAISQMATEILGPANRPEVIYT